MRPVRQHLTMAGAGPVIVVDFAAQTNNFDMQVGAGGSSTTLWQTLDDVFAVNFNANSAVWTPIPGTGAMTANTSITVTSNPTAVRAVIGTYVGPVDVTLVPNSDVL